MTRRQILQLGGATAAAQSLPQTKPNIIVLFADDMGYGDLSCYGHPNIQTPNLDRLASEGIRFTSGYAAASVCTPSRVGLLTGRYAKRAGLPNNLGPESIGGLPLTEITIAQQMKSQGYNTAAIGKWHIGHSPKEYLPTSRGFDQYLGLLYSNDMIPPWVKTDRPLHLWRNNDAIEPVTDQSQLTERYTDEALNFIRKSAGNPFFLYLPYAMPHLPVSAPASRRGRSRAGLYGDTIETLDWSAGQILNELKTRGIDNNTLVVFCSDNGPWHDLPPRMLAQGVEPWHTGSKSLFRGAKGTTYEGGHRVPFLARWPGTIPAGRTSSEMVSTLDFFPTFSAAAGAKVPTDRIYDGYNLLPTLKGQAPSPRDNYKYFLGPDLQAIRQGPWKYRKVGQNPPELFHLDFDPAEQYNVHDRNPDIAQSLASRLAADRVNI
ncbi:MAG: sulfatase [Acidobacteria bacterium]|nr:sulfatase [Acidobacteriota bacterium]